MVVVDVEVGYGGVSRVLRSRVTLAAAMRSAGLMELPGMNSVTPIPTPSRSRGDEVGYLVVEDVEVGYCSSLTLALSLSLGERGL